MVPNAAITDRGNGPGVWIVDNATSTVTFRPVTILRLSEEETYLGGGLVNNTYAGARRLRIAGAGRSPGTARTGPGKECGIMRAFEILQHARTHST